jgi:hypothetical protein
MTPAGPAPAVAEHAEQSHDEQAQGAGLGDDLGDRDVRDGAVGRVAKVPLPATPW